MTVAVLTDSAASLPSDLAAAHGVAVVPMTITVGDRSYRDGELTLREVSERRGEGLATAGPPPGLIAEALGAALVDHDAAVMFTVAASMSSTHDSARVAASGFEGRVAVVDTGTAAGAQGLVTLAAARAAASGAGPDEVLATAQQAADAVRLVAVLGSVEHLVASGRVPAVAGRTADRLGVNPLFEFRAGAARPLRPALSAQAAADRILARWRGSTGGPDSAVHVAALHAGRAAAAEDLLARVRAEVEPATMFVAPFSAVMVAHTGDDLLGLAWWWERRS